MRVPLSLPLSAALRTSGMPDGMARLFAAKAAAASGQPEEVPFSAEEILAQVGTPLAHSTLPSVIPLIPYHPSFLCCSPVACFVPTRLQLPPEMAKMSVPVGTAVIRVASVRWQRDQPASRRAQQVPSDADIIASDRRQGGGAVVGANPNAEDDALGEGDNPYALRLTGSFLQVCDLTSHTFPHFPTPSHTFPCLPMPSHAFSAGCCLIAVQVGGVGGQGGALAPRRSRAHPRVGGSPGRPAQEAGGQSRRAS